MVNSDDVKRTPPRGSIDWRRMVAEGVLIVGSVYLAIYLEGVSQERGRMDDARTALTLLRAELEEDRRDLNEIVAEQTMLSGKYADLARWLSNPSETSAIQFDSLQSTLDLIAYSNRTMFPRKGAWTTMLAEGYLGELDDPDLVARLSTLYGRIHDRLEYNGRYYDESLFPFLRETLPAGWDYQRARPVEDPERLRVMRDQLRFMQTTWNAWYVAFLGEYGEELDSVIEAVDGHLER